MNVLHLNGKKCHDRRIVSLYNPSFLYGINCFEGIRAYWQPKSGDLKFLDLELHLERLYSSMAGLSFEAPVPIKKLAEEIYGLAQTESLREDSYFRVTVFIGDGASWHDAKDIHYMVSARSLPSQLGTRPPVSVGISNYTRISSHSMPPTIKAGANYLNSRYALLEARNKGHDEALFLTQSGFISEGTGANIFFIKEGRLHTPSIECDILVGITRARIIKLCKDRGIEVVEENITENRLKDFEAAFMSGTMVEIRPVEQIEQFGYKLEHPLYLELVDAMKHHVQPPS